MAGTIRFTPSEDDYVAALRLQYVRQIVAPKFWKRMGLLTISAAVAVAVIGGFTDGDWLLAIVTGAVGAIGGCGALGIVIGGNFLMLPRRSRRLFRQQTSLHRETEFSWNDTGSHWRSDRADVRTDWVDYHRWHEGRAILLLYLNDHLMHFVPKRALDDAQIHDLRAILTIAEVPVR